MDRRAPNQEQCPRCGQNTAETRTERETFRYGTGDAAAELTALVPVHACTSCGFEYTDASAEDARHEAVCQHLGILNPRQVAGIRKLYRFTRAEFATLTRFGEASLARWETGAITQNPANDQLLYLLQFRDNMERLQERARCNTSIEPTSLPVPERKFVALHNIEEKRQEAKAFALHKQDAVA
jgi:putative zinc finger/helix-turn-helix YgiT family protein